MFQHVKSKFINPSKTRHWRRCLGCGHGFPCRQPVRSFTTLLSSLKENMFGSTFYNTTNLSVHISNHTPTVALVIMTIHHSEPTIIQWTCNQNIWYLMCWDNSRTCNCMPKACSLICTEPHALVLHTWYCGRCSGTKDSFTGHFFLSQLRINDVKDMLARRFMLKETRRYQSNSLCASLANY